jgi:long-subunit fatty acid transport protein
MKKNSVKKLTKTLLFFFFIGIFFEVSGQQLDQKKLKNDFWNHVQLGGGFGLNTGTGFTDITIAPNAIYNFNHFVSLGAGLQGSIVSQKDYYSSGIYGASIITLFNPIDEAQLSVELEQVRVNNTFRNPTKGTLKDNFWNTGLFVGAGYRMDNVTVGMRYNVLFNKDKNVYSDALMPFIRVYF